MESRLPAGEGHHGVAHLLDGHGAQGAGNLLAGGQEHIHLSARGVGIELQGFLNEIVRGVSLGGEHHHHIVSLFVCVGDDAGHIAHTLRICHRGTSKFLYD